MFTQNFVELVCLVVEGNLSVLFLSKTGILSMNSELDQAEQFDIIFFIRFEIVFKEEENDALPPSNIVRLLSMQIL